MITEGVSMVMNGQPFIFMGHHRQHTSRFMEVELIKMENGSGRLTSSRWKGSSDSVTLTLHLNVFYKVSARISSKQKLFQLFSSQTTKQC